jgi:hypothetical protein
MDLTIELTEISDPKFAALSLPRAEQGLTCERCAGSEEPVIAVLEIRELERAWALCSLCIRDLPQGFRVA